MRTVRYRILGALSVGDAEITAGRDRVVLAMLLLHANRIVSTDRLIDALWETDPPATARNQLQTCVSRLRRALPDGTIRTDPAGYGIDVAPAELDSLRFVELVESGQAGAALELWRGPVLAGIGSPVVQRLAAGLDERYAEMVEDADLPVAELSVLVERFPARERLRGRLMLGLNRAGRRADALAEFRRARAFLRDELGIEPGPALQEVHRQILSEEVAPVRGLPRTVGDFTGRHELLARLRSAVEDAPPGPLVRVIDGMAGVGKTTLAVHLAGLVGDRYPDAHLFIDLHGHSERVAEAPGDALVTLLRQLGVPAERIPSRLEGRSALWRSELAGRRALVVLDNAATSAQVQPLLPGTGDSLTLITSRARLTGLDGVRPESVQLLTEPEAVELFTQIVGDRARVEPAATVEVVRRCGLLPLGVRLAGARLARRRRWQVADLARRLGEAGLTALTVEDRAVSAAFALSYTQLAEDRQLLFRTLGLYPGERFDVTAAAALSDLGSDEAEDMLDSLVDVHLLEAPEPGRYRFHDLVREYATMLIGSADEDVRRAAQMRLLNHTMHSAATLSKDLETPVNRRSLILDPVWRPDLLPGPGTGAMAWLDRERGSLLAIQAMGAAIGAHREVWLLARAAWRLWYLRPYYGDLIEAHERGLAAARALGDPMAIATMANYLASGLHRVSRVHEAAQMLEAARDSYVVAGDGTQAYRILANLAVLKNALGDFGAAADLAERSYVGARRRQDMPALVVPLWELAFSRDRQGDLPGALLLLRRAISVLNETGPRFRSYVGLMNLAIVRLRLGHRVGERYVRLSIVLAERFGFRSSVVEGHTALGVHFRRSGRYAEAIAEHRIALDIVGEVVESRLQLTVRLDFGYTLLAVGDRMEAQRMFRWVTDLARSIDARFEEARGMAGMAETTFPDDPVRARRYAERALALFTEMGTPEQHEVAKWLRDR